MEMCTVQGETVGFFTDKELQGSRRIKKRKSKHAGCGACKLHKQCISPRMPATGEGKKGMFTLGEFPGTKEDKRNRQLIGKAGQLTRRVVRENGLDLEEDFVNTNALCCRPPENKIKDGQWIDHCRPHVMKALEEAEPKVVILFGYYALRSYFGDRSAILGDKLTKWRGWTIPDFENDRWVVPTFHPRYVLQQDDNPMVKFYFKRDIAKAIRLRTYNVPIYEEKVKIVNDRNAIKKMNNIRNFSYFAFDVETTGLKPNAPGHKILSCAITTPKETFAFMMDNKAVVQAFVGLLRNDKIGKIGQNISFEERWCRTLLNTPVACWIWDTMLASHTLDNRDGITGLKFQAMANHGVMQYNDEVTEYISSKEGHGNAFNTLHLMRKKSLLQYNGDDSGHTFKLAINQMRRMGILDPLTIIKKKRSKTWVQW